VSKEYSIFLLLLFDVVIRMTIKQQRFYLHHSSFYSQACHLGEEKFQRSVDEEIKGVSEKKRVRKAVGGVCE